MLHTHRAEFYMTKHPIAAAEATQSPSRTQEALMRYNFSAFLQCDSINSQGN